jgi:conjugative relaxase-like TrwC/TraI family protein
LGEYYSERETRTPVWLLAGDTRNVATLVGLTDAQRAGGDADAELVASWLDDGITPSGAHGRAFGERGVHGFDLTFCSPKSVSLVRALRTDDVMAKAIADAHTTALSEAMEYLAAHAGYTRVHNPRTGEKDLVRLPGLVAIAYQHETSRCGDPHLHTHYKRSREVMQPK